MRKRERIWVDLNEEAISVDDDEETIQLTATVLSVEYVYVIPPPHRRRDDFCCIFGDISVTDDLSKPAVILFRREIDDPQVLDLADNAFCYLYVTHHESDRALRGNSDNYVTLRLYEKKIAEEEEEEEEDPDGGEDQSGSDSQEEEEDQEILDTKQFKFGRSTDNTSVIEWDGKCGFNFEMRHAAILGVRVHVEVKFNKDIELIETGTVESIYGYITAWQQLDTPLRYAGVRLYSVSQHEPVVVRVGEPLPLDRHAVVAPIANGWLCIEFALRSGDGKKSWVTDELVHFAILPTDNFHNVFLTNKNRKHTKLVAGGLISVSITFVD